MARTDKAGATALVEQVRANLLRIRNETPADWAEAEDGYTSIVNAVYAEEAQLTEARRMVADLPRADLLEFARTWFEPVRMLIESVLDDARGGLLPRAPNDPSGMPGEDPEHLNRREMAEDARYVGE